VDDEAIVQLLRRGRLLVAQSTSRLILDQLGLALADPPGLPDDQRLARLLDQSRARPDTELSIREPRHTGQ
jgi:hypothetical protein